MAQLPSRRRKVTERRLPAVILALTISFVAPALALDPLEQIEVETFGKMREVERYQLKVAEKFYTKGEYKIALDEYDKFLTLYEKSPGAPYALLMWSHAQVKLRMVNTAIREGFQSVVDYYPDSREAVLASFLIGNSYDDIGQVEKAEKGYLKTINDYPKAHIATLAKVRLLHFAKVQKDEKKQMFLLADLTYNTERTKTNKGHVLNAVHDLAKRHIYGRKYDEAIRALETTYREGDLVKTYNDIAKGAISHYLKDEKTKQQAIELSDSLIGMVATLIPDVLGTPENKAAARDAWYRIASLYGLTGRPTKILETYEKMVTILGEDDGLLGSIAGYHRGRKQYDKARAVYARFKDKLKAALATAETYREEKRYDEAIAIYAALEDQVMGQGLLAALYSELGRYDDAIACYQTLMEIDRANIGKHRWSIGACYESSKRLRQAIAAYGLVDNFPTTYFKMASLHRKLKEWPQALSLYSQCKVHEGKAPDAFMEIARTYEEAGQRENSIRAFQLVCKNFPKKPHASVAHSHLQSKYGISVTLGGAKDE